MADTPESKPHFWSSLPGIFTGVAGVLAALTGLIIAWNNLGSKPNSNSVPPVNSNVTNASTPGASPNSDQDRYKSLAGKWRVVEKPSLNPHFEQVETVTWDYEAAVNGAVLTLKGRILFVNDVDDEPVKGEERLTATYEATLTGLSGNGRYRFTTMNEDVVSNEAKIQLDDNLEKFEVKIEANGRTHTLTGRKL